MQARSLTRSRRLLVVGAVLALAPLAAGTRSAAAPGGGAGNAAKLADAIKAVSLAIDYERAALNTIETGPGFGYFESSHLKTATVHLAAADQDVAAAAAAGEIDASAARPIRDSLATAVKLDKEAVRAAKRRDKNFFTRLVQNAMGSKELVLRLLQSATVTTAALGCRETTAQSTASPGELTFKIDWCKKPITEISYFVGRPIPNASKLGVLVGGQLRSTTCTGIGTPTIDCKIVPPMQIGAAAFIDLPLATGSTIMIRITPASGQVQVLRETIKGGAAASATGTAVEDAATGNTTFTFTTSGGNFSSLWLDIPSGYGVGFWLGAPQPPATATAVCGLQGAQKIVCRPKQGSSAPPQTLEAYFQLSPPLPAGTILHGGIAPATSAQISSFSFPVQTK